MYITAKYVVLHVFDGGLPIRRTPRKISLDTVDDGFSSSDDISEDEETMVSNGSGSDEGEPESTIVKVTRRTTHTITTMNLGASDSNDDSTVDSGDNSSGNFEALYGVQEWTNDDLFNVPLMVSGIRNFHEKENRGQTSATYGDTPTLSTNAAEGAIGVVNHRRETHQQRRQDPN